MATFFSKLKNGLQKTNRAIAEIFTGKQIDDALYEELESALLMADTGVAATQYLLDELKVRVKKTKASDSLQVKALLIDAMTDLLEPLQGKLVLASQPTVMMVAGVNGAGKTTSIGKLTWHFAHSGHSVLLAAADTFRAAAREQLSVWADRNQGGQNNTRIGKVEIISTEGADPSSVCFDAVIAGKARGTNLVIADTAGRLPTQTHLMAELTKIKRVIQKADASAPHEVLLVLDGNTGQNALAQAQAFDAAINVTGLIITKLDGTAKGGVLAAIALWGRELAATGKPAPHVYFIGVGEALEDLQPFVAREFAQALLS
ncbi:MAG: signal recognition particle-docking protein FtsY [Cytophagales bacterium]|nr:signal recognition particle-docking protein FtsY [Cytophagales bacterium]